MTRQSLTIVMVLVGLLASTANLHAVTRTWDGGGDGSSWNNGNNWDPDGFPSQTADTLDITLANATDVINNVYRDTGTGIYDGGSTYRGNVNLNRGTITFPAHFGSGANGTFNIGDGTLTSGLPDSTVNVSNAGWRFDRHSDGTFTVNIRQDGVLAGGTFLNYNAHTNRKWVINVDGGSMTSPNAWNMSDGAGFDANLLNLTQGGTVDVGAITVHEEVIDFADFSASSFTADFGGSFADIAAVNSAIGTRFTAISGGALGAVDNGGSFTVSLLPTQVGGDANLATDNLSTTLQNATTDLGPVKRVRVVQNLAETFQVVELQAFEAATGTNVAEASNGGVASYTGGSHSAGNIANANDGVTAVDAWWHSTSTTPGASSLEIEFTNATEVENVHFWGRKHGCCDQRQDDFNLILEDTGGTEVYNQRILGAGTSPGQNLLINVATITGGEELATLVNSLGYFFELDGDTPTNSDQITVPPSGPTYTSILDVNSAPITIELETGTLDGGEVFTLFDVDSFTGSLGTVTLPAVNVGQQWDQSNLLVNGSLAFNIVPVISDQNGNWNTDANWDGDLRPQDVANAVDVQVDGEDITVAAASFGDSLALSAGSVSINSGQTLSITNDVDITGGVLTSGTGTLSATNVNVDGGELAVGTGTIPASVTVDGGELSSDGTLAASSFTFTSGIVDANGSFNVDAATTYGAGRTLDVGGSNLNVQNDLNMTGGTLTSTGSTITVSDGATLTTGAALAVGTLITNNTGAVNAGAANAITVATLVNGTGTITGNLSVAGTHDVGNSPGLQSIVGNYAVTGSLDLEIDGLDGAGVNPDGHDQLDVDGTVTVTGGTLNLDFTDLDTNGGVGNSVVNLILIDNDGSDAIIGEFTGFSEGQLVHTDASGRGLHLTYTGGSGNDLALIPEPRSIVLALFGLLGLGWYGWRRRKS